MTLFLALALTLPPQGSPVFSSYFGGSGVTAGAAVAVGADGTAYLLANTGSADLPCSGSLTGIQNMVLLEVSGTGWWCEYLGGSGTDTGNGIAVDAAGDIYLAGSTTSPDLGTPGAYQSMLRGLQDGFVCELDASADVIWFTYLGTKGSNQANAIAVDSTGAAYVAGYSTTKGYPVRGKVTQKSFGGGPHDAVFTKVSPGGGSLDWSGYLGGQGDDVAYALALAPDGTVYLNGYTGSINFPTTAGAYQTDRRALSVAWVTRLGSDGGIAQSTLLGGSSSSESPCPACSSSLAIDSNGNPWVGGLTSETNFPVTPGAAQRKYAGGPHDAFLSELTPELDALTYSTFAGGTQDDGFVALAFDANGNLWAHGNTFSRDFPVLNPWQDRNHGDFEATISEYSPTGELLLASYWGGSLEEYAAATQSIACASACWVTGWTLSPDFPLIDPIQAQLNGLQDAWLLSFDPAL